MKAFIEDIGALALEKLQSFTAILSFALQCIKHLFNFKNYNSAVIDVLIVQIYFTSVQIFLLFLVISVIFGTIFMGFFLQSLNESGLTALIGKMMVGFVFIELVPLSTVLLLALRSSAAINTEIAVMKVNRELDALQVFKIDMINYLFLPRFISVMISALILGCFFALIVSVSGFLFSKLFFNMDFGVYTAMIFESLTIKNTLIVFFKSVIFTFFITLIPFHAGTHASYELTAIPVAVLQGMVRVFIAIVLIEVLSLAVRFL